MSFNLIPTATPTSSRASRFIFNKRPLATTSPTMIETIRTPATEMAKEEMTPKISRPTNGGKLKPPLTIEQRMQIEFNRQNAIRRRQETIRKQKQSNNQYDDKFYTDFSPTSSRASINKRPLTTISPTMIETIRTPATEMAKEEMTPKISRPTNGGKLKPPLTIEQRMQIEFNRQNAIRRRQETIRKQKQSNNQYDDKFYKDFWDEVNREHKEKLKKEKEEREFQLQIQKNRRFVERFLAKKKPKTQKSTKKHMRKENSFMDDLSDEDDIWKVTSKINKRKVESSGEDEETLQQDKSTKTTGNKNKKATEANAYSTLDYLDDQAEVTSGEEHFDDGDEDDENDTDNSWISQGEYLTSLTQQAHYSKSVVDVLSSGFHKFPQKRTVRKYVSDTESDEHEEDTDESFVVSDKILIEKVETGVYTQSMNDAKVVFANEKIVAALAKNKKQKSQISVGIKLHELRVVLERLVVPSGLKKIPAGSPLKQYPCTFDNCKSSFKRKHDMEVHTRRHSKKQQYNCKLCPSTFPTSNKLNLHARTHSNSKRIACEKCGKMFNTKDARNMHLKRTHGLVVPSGLKKIPAGSPLKQYPCTFDNCKSSFKRKHDMEVHARRHSKKQQYNCKLCPSAFPTSNKLNLHARTHSNSKCIACEKCGKMFNTKDARNMHLKRTHGNEDK